MTANITNQDYSQQVNAAFDALKFATPQQLAAVSQQVQQNPNTPEAMALAMATQYQQQMRQPKPEAPQQTVLQKNIAALQGQANPAQGLPNVGQNQMALQQAAGQNPNMAGIAAAPENMGPPPQAGIPGAATGGLVAFAHGGDVRGYSDGQTVEGANYDPAPRVVGQTFPALAQMGSNFGQNVLAPFGNAMYEDIANFGHHTGQFNKALAAGVKSINSPAYGIQWKQTHKGHSPLSSMGQSFLGVDTEGPEEVSSSNVSSARGIPGMGVSDEALGITSPEDKYSLSQPQGVDALKEAFQKPKFGGIPAATPKAAPEVDTEEGEQEEVGEQRRVDPSATNKVSGILAAGNGLSPEEQISRLSKMFSVDHGVAAELKGQWEKEIADHEKSNMLSAIAAGAGAMLAGGPNKPAAIGQGLMALVGQYGKGEEEQRAMKRQMAGLDLNKESQDRAAQQEAAKMYLQDMMEQRKAKAAAQAKIGESTFERDTRLALGRQTGEYGLQEADIRNRNAIALENLRSLNDQKLEDYKAKVKQGMPLSDADKKDIYNTLWTHGSPMGLTNDQIKQEYDRAIITITGKGGSTQRSAPTSMGGGIFFTPPTQ